MAKGGGPSVNIAEKKVSHLLIYDDGVAFTPQTKVDTVKDNAHGLAWDGSVHKRLSDHMLLLRLRAQAIPAKIKDNPPDTGDVTVTLINPPDTITAMSVAYANDPNP